MVGKNQLTAALLGVVAGVLLALLAAQGMTVAAGPDRTAEELVKQGNVLPPDVLEYGRR